MKIAYYFTIILITSLSCVNSDESTIDPVLNQAPESPFFSFEKDLSYACNICLLMDSIAEIRQKINFTKAYGDPLDSNLLERKNDLEEVLKEWKVAFKKNEPTVFEMELPENWGSRDAENIALQACKNEFTFTNEIDSTQRQRFLMQYVSYAYYSKLGIMEKNIDTATIEKIAGNYVIKFHGEDVLIKSRDFPTYWEKATQSNEAATAYVDTKKDEAVEQITGKPFSELSKIEQIMFLKHADSANRSASNMAALVLDDQLYQTLYDNWINAWLNK